MSRKKFFISLCVLFVVLVSGAFYCTWREFLDVIVCVYIGYNVKHGRE